jgi:hypothetical protein
MVDQDNEFSHDGGERDFGRFACRAQALVELAQGPIGTGGRQRGHVESAAHRRAPGAKSVPARRPADRAALIPAPARSWRWRRRRHSTLQSGTCPVRWVCLLPRGAQVSAFRPPLPERDGALARTFSGDDRRAQPAIFPPALAGSRLRILLEPYSAG